MAASVGFPFRPSQTPRRCCPTGLPSSWLKPGRPRTPSRAYDRRWLAPLLEALARAGFPVREVDDVRAVLWGKLLINVAINPFGALLGVPNGALREDPAALLFMRRAVEEVLQVVEALGIALPFEDPWGKVLEVLDRAAANRNSMLQDLERGAPTEIDALCGAVVRYARQLGLRVPMNETLLDMIVARVRERSKK